MREDNAPKRQYTDEFKIEAIRLSDSVSGREAARRLGIPSATLSNWSRKRRPVDLPPVPETSSAQPLRWPVTELEAEAGTTRRWKASSNLEGRAHLL